MALLLALHGGCTALAGGERYRGDYTFGHEVNSFCPEINSECYWLGPNSRAAREQLKRIYRNKTPGLYKPVCVVVDGVIDRGAARDGFAADYDGVIDIVAVIGDCDSGVLIVPGDLSHRRWVLAERNGVPVDTVEPPAVLDFGERLFVEGRDGCQRFSGFTGLIGNELVFNKVEFDRSGCSAGDLAKTLFRARSAWRARVAGDALVLSNGVTHLAFTRNDWR